MKNKWSSKQECRSFYRNLCAEKFAQGLVQNQQQVNVSLLKYFSQQQGIWGSYRALPLEAEADVVRGASHIDWIFPRIKGEGLEFCRPAGWTQGPFGVWEPDQNSEVIPESQIQGFIVPGLVFNLNGNRLGKGKGFYDRVLADFPGKKVGLCFDFQISQTELPMEAHDRRVDYIISESGCVDCRRYQK